MNPATSHLEIQMNQLKHLRNKTNLNRREFSALFGIPIRTLEDWEAGRRKMPDYLLRLIIYRLQLENFGTFNPKNINIITEIDGRKIVLINDIRFKSRRTINWNDIENYLKEYIGEYYEITESSEQIYIGTDFPDEFCHSKDTKGLKGANEKAKANIAPAIDKLIEIATNRMDYPDFSNKHKSKAKLGWYRYDTRFGIPVYDENEELVRYNIFSTRMLVRCDKDGHLYLYDFVRTKKETSKPLEQ